MTLRESIKEGLMENWTQKLEDDLFWSIKSFIDNLNSNTQTDKRIEEVLKAIGPEACMEYLDLKMNRISRNFMSKEELVSTMTEAWLEYINNLQSKDDAGIYKAMEYVVTKLDLTK